MRKLLLLVLLPTCTFATIGDELNSLLERFFGSEIEEAPVETPSEFVSEELPSLTRQSVQEEIFQEENTLQNTEATLRTTEQKLVELENRQKTLDEQLFILDTELAPLNKSLKVLSEQEKRWKTALENLTREKSDLRALLRIQEAEYQKFLQKNYLRNESLNLAGKGAILRWLFSEKTVSQILEETQRQKQFEQQKGEKLKKLQAFRKELDRKEKYTASLYGKIAELHLQIAKEKKLLSDVAENKANILAHLEYKTGATQKEITNLQQQQAHSTILLQNLYQGLKELRKESAKNEDTFLQTANLLAFPLKVPLQIMAGFHDPEYEKEFEEIHEGVDFLAPQGTDIFAPADGVVKNTSQNGYGYSYFILEHDNGLHTVYGHVSDILVNEGQSVKRGDLIGKTGGEAGAPGSGYFTAGPHLHFEVLKDGEYVDPMLFLEKNGA